MSLIAYLIILARAVCWSERSPVWRYRALIR